LVEDYAGFTAHEAIAPGSVTALGAGLLAVLLLRRRLA
jgi:hypothetical protein